MSKILMKCGHTANAQSSYGEPCCAICYPDSDSITPEPKIPDLTSRIAKCVSCHHTQPSNFNLPFFAYLENEKEDSYYCGCRGWN